MSDGPVSNHALLYAAIAILICWRIFRRVRRLIGRQPVRVRSLTVTAVLFVILIAVLGLSSLRSPALIEGLAAGAAVGVGLGWLGLRLTRFEKTDAGYFYVPNTVLGVAVSLLFIGRLIYRFASIYLSSGSGSGSGSGNIDPATLQSFHSSPLTLAAFGLVAAYYATFAIGVLSWHRRSRNAAASDAAVDVTRL